MLATEQFKMRIEPNIKQMLSVIAAHEKRSQSDAVRVLIMREYEYLKSLEVKPAGERPQSDQAQPSRELQAAL